MTDSETLPCALYPALIQVQPSLADLGAAVAPVTVLFSENTPCQGFPLVLDGEIKVSRSSGDGRWLETPAFRNEVLGLFAERMADLTSLVDAVAFHRLDRRLAAALLGHGSQLSLTHTRRWPTNWAPCARW